MTRPSSLPRARWSERWDRPGWRQEFTVAGGRLRAGDPVAALPTQESATATRLLSQACFSITSDGDVPALSDTSLRWATVARKILQRGARPAIAARAEEIIRASFGDVPAARASQVEAAMGWSDQGWRLADEYELDATYERPLWDWVVDRTPTLARWLVPQASLESLAGELDERVSARWVDFLFCAPWLKAPAVLEIDGRGHQRREGADRARDAALAGTGCASPASTARMRCGRMARSYRRFAATRTGRARRRSRRTFSACSMHPLLRPGSGWRSSRASSRASSVPGSHGSSRSSIGSTWHPTLAGVALDPLRAVSELWDAGVVPDEVVVNGRTWLLGGGRSSVREARPGDPDLVMASVVAALGSSQQPVAIDRARIDRQIRELALEHAGGRLGDDTYHARLKALREQRDAIVERTAPGLPGHRAVEWLRALGESFQTADVPKEKADLMHAIYERITVAGPEIVGVRLTTAAYAHGLALALPQKVEMARPTGFGHGDTTMTVRVPIATAVVNVSSQ